MILLLSSRNPDTLDPHVSIYSPCRLGRMRVPELPCSSAFRTLSPLSENRGHQGPRLYPQLIGFRRSGSDAGIEVLLLGPPEPCRMWSHLFHPLESRRSPLYNQRGIGVRSDRLPVPASRTTPSHGGLYCRNQHGLQEHRLPVGQAVPPPPRRTAVPGVDGDPARPASTRHTRNRHTGTASPGLPWRSLPCGSFPEPISKGILQNRHQQSSDFSSSRSDIQKPVSSGNTRWKKHLASGTQIQRLRSDIVLLQPSSRHNRPE